MFITLCYFSGGLENLLQKILFLAWAVEFL